MERVYVIPARAYLTTRDINRYLQINKESTLMLEEEEEEEEDPEAAFLNSLTKKQKKMLLKYVELD